MDASSDKFGRGILRMYAKHEHQLTGGSPEAALIAGKL